MPSNKLIYCYSYAGYCRKQEKYLREDIIIITPRINVDAQSNRPEATRNSHRDKAIQNLTRVS